MNGKQAKGKDYCRKKRYEHEAWQRKTRLIIRSDVKYRGWGTNYWSKDGKVGDGSKSPGEANLGAEEEGLCVYGRKELRIGKDTQRWAEEVSSEKVLQTL